MTPTNTDALASREISDHRSSRRAPPLARRSLVVRSSKGAPLSTSGPHAIVVAAGVAILLGAGIIALAFVNPYALIGLPPVLLAVAAIVRALTGTTPPDPR